MSEAFENVSVTFELNADSLDTYFLDEYDEYDIPGEDIPVICEWNKNQWEQIPFEFELVAPLTYNYDNIPMVFQITPGSISEDISVIFSIVRAPQDFASYIMQKTYSVASEIYGNTDLEISDWNVSPNKTWYLVFIAGWVVLFEVEVTTELLSDGEWAAANVKAIGIIDPNTLHVVLYYATHDENQEMVMGDKVDFYYQDVLNHLTISMAEPPLRIFRIKPFTDMSEIGHPIYNNSNIVLSRGEAELNLHTFTVMARELLLGTHIPEMEVGEVIDCTSTRRNISEKNQILSHTISGELSDDGTASLTNTVRVAKYTELYRR